MRKVEIYRHPAKQLTVRVKRGFSWPAFLFGGFWYLAKGMGFRFLFWLLLQLALNIIIFIFFDPNLAPILGFLSMLTVGALIGCVANAQYRNRLGRRGYRHVGVSEGSSGGVISVGEPTKKCPRCAAQIHLEAVVCGSCGHQFDYEEVRQQIISAKQGTGPPGSSPFSQPPRGA